MKNLSQNALEELSALMRDLQDSIDKYLHVSEHLPKGIKTGIEKFHIKVINELEKRED
jgi:hypothetical protein